MKQKPLILFDTDMDTDVDDAGALAILLSYVKQGKADLLGIIADGPDRYAPAACEALCRHYGITCPIGTVYEADFAKTDRFAKYFAQHRYLTPERQYTHALAKTIGKRDSDYPAAAATYRSLLAGAPDHSVTIVCVGLLTALDALLRSAPDEISPLSGVELVKRKAVRLVSMTNAVYPAVIGKNFNYDMDPTGSAYVVATMPVPIHASPDGAAVITGQTLTDRLPATHPLRLSYEMYNEGERRGRSSWDLIAVLYALEEGSPLFVANERGQLFYEADTLHTGWTQGDRADREVRLAVSQEEMAAILEKLMADAG